MAVRGFLPCASAVVIALLAAPVIVAAQTCDPPSQLDSPRLNHTWRISAHNAYFHGTEWIGPPFPVPPPPLLNLDIGSSGPKQHLLDMLYIDRVRGLEFDLHGVDGSAAWKVFHTSDVGGSLCVNFEDCLRVMRAYHLANPRHDVIFIHIESKEVFSPASKFFEAPKSPEVLDATITSVLGDAVFGPVDYLDWCRQEPDKGASAVSEKQCYGEGGGPDTTCAQDADCQPGQACDVDLRAAAASCGWPTMRYLRGRFIFTLHGGEPIVLEGHPVTSDNRPNVVQYENSRISERKIFTMDSPTGSSIFRERMGAEEIPALVQSNVVTRGGWNGDTLFPGQIAGAILTRNDVPDVAGQNIVATDAPRSTPMSYLHSDLVASFAARTCGPAPDLGLASGLNWSSSCLFEPAAGKTAAEETLGYLEECDPCALREENSGIFVSVKGAGGHAFENGFLRVYGDEILYLARQTEPRRASIRAFVSTRTLASTGGQVPSETYGHFFPGIGSDLAPPCDDNARAIISLGKTYTGSLGCLMARENLTDTRGLFVAICRNSDRNGWYSSPFKGAFLVFRAIRSHLPGGLPQEPFVIPIFVPQAAPENGVGYAELQNFFRLEHSADGKCWKAYMQSTIDPPAEPRWGEQQIGGEICFDAPLPYVGLATDGGPPGSRGDYLFANLQYDGRTLTLAHLAETEISHSGDVEKLLIDDRSFFPDTDGDGIADNVEDVNGNGRKDPGETDADDPDTDDDGLDDGDELARGTLPLDPDSDKDLLEDGEEVALGTDPLDPDSDTDGLLDGEEVHVYGSLPLVPDTDGDNLRDGDEVKIYGTSPLDKDTDDDELEDGDEVVRGTNPLDGDTDDDGLQDGFEVREGLDPQNPDSDADGILDGQDPDLVANFLNKLPRSAFRTIGIRRALLVRLDAIERDLTRGARVVVLNQLRSLREQMDGCGTTPDPTDWIIDCDAQNATRFRLDVIISNIQASGRRGARLRA